MSVLNLPIMPQQRLLLDAQPGVRPRVAGKFLFVGDHKLWIRGVTYGTFAPRQDGEDYPPDDVLTRDFAAMSVSGINTVRCYTVPPRRLLDRAWAHGLRVMVGLPWEQHVAFLEEPERARDILRRVAEGVRRCAGHPAVLCYAIGNEIPASIVRWVLTAKPEVAEGQVFDLVR